MTELPAITPEKLVRLLEREGWVFVRKSNHGYSYTIYDPSIGRKRVTIIPYHHPRRPLPKGTLNRILGPDQTNIGRAGLVKLIKKYGRKKK